MSEKLLVYEIIGVIMNFFSRIVISSAAFLVCVCSAYASEVPREFGPFVGSFRVVSGQCGSSQIKEVNIFYNVAPILEVDSSGNEQKERSLIINITRQDGRLIQFYLGEYATQGEGTFGLGKFTISGNKLVHQQSSNTSSKQTSIVKQSDGSFTFRVESRSFSERTCNLIIRKPVL